MTESKHIVAVFGGAVSGSEAASQLAKRGIRVFVFDQNALPYGKIEDGLPKWHVKLRDKEENRINEKLNHPLITFVPKVELGRDIGFEELANEWGFSASILAIGAWKDRPLPIEGIDNYLNKGFYYQNPFIYWFNHFHEPNFRGSNHNFTDGAIVIGGGLASIDVCKALMMLNVEQKLKERGHEVNLFQLDRGINRVLEGLNLSLDDLGLKGCTLYYRRRIKDMPLSPMLKDTPEKLAKAQLIQEKVCNNATKKFLFKVEPLCSPVDKIVEQGELKGLVFRKNKIEEGKLEAVSNSEFKVNTPLIISSIGSLPVPIEGIPMKWQTYDVSKDECCQISGYDHVFAIGNAVTGRGNINESLKHGRDLSEALSTSLREIEEKGFEQALREAEEGINEKIQKILPKIESLTPPTPEKINEIESKIASFHKAAGYQGNYMQWIKEHQHTRLEDLLDSDHH